MTAPRRERVKAAFRAVHDLLKYRDMLTEPLEANLRELRGQLSEILCPYTTQQLDEHKKELDEKFPEYEHWYIRCGETVTWCDRRKPESDTEVRPASRQVPPSRDRHDSRP